MSSSASIPLPDGDFLLPAAGSPSQFGDSPAPLPDVSISDFQALFKAAPGMFLVLSPELRILVVSDHYLAATMTKREEIVGQLLVDVFPNNPADPTATGTRNLRDSLERVLRERVPDAMAVQKYDIRRPAAEGGGCEEWHWCPVNSPIIGSGDQVAFIIHHVEDVTDTVLLKKAAQQLEERAEVLRKRAEQSDAESFVRAQELQRVHQQVLQANGALQAEVQERQAAEERSEELARQLRTLNDKLESRVQQRTEELAEANRALSHEMAQRFGAQERFRLVVESAPHAMVMLDQLGAIVLVNRQTENYFGYRREELLGKPAEILSPQRFRKQHRSDLNRFLADPTPWAMAAGQELFGRRRDGTEFPIEIGLNHISTSEGGFVLTAIMDITQRKQAEKALRQSELRFRAIFNHAYGFVGLLNTDGTMLESNKSSLDFLNLTLADVVGKPMWDTAWFTNSPQTRDYVKQAVAAAAAGGFVRREMTAPDADGNPRTFDFSIKPVIDDAGQVEMLIPEGRDITDQKMLEEQFRQAQKMEAVGKLAGGVAHDFNNLLTIILGYSDVLQDSLREGSPLREMVNEIYKAGSRAAGLTRQLLAFSRKQVLVPVVIDLNTLLEEMEKMLVRMIGEDMNMIFRPGADLWRVRVDPGQIEQVVMNLVINSRDAMPQRGKLTIETENVVLDAPYAAGHPDARTGEHVLLSVSDTGCGMDRATLARIFEPFFSTKGDHGTGLGLPTVYGIVKQSGGHVAVTSEPLCGTSFKVYLPRESDNAGVSQAALPAKSRLDGTETVLLVEDDDGVRTLARLTLQRHGYKVLEARNGGEALLLCEQHLEAIHLLATDVVMPNMSGRELADRLLLLLRPGLRVLYMSGYMDDAIVRHGLLNDEAPFIAKPYTPGALANKVREVLD